MQTVRSHYPIISIKKRRPWLANSGLDLEYFPNYVKLKPQLHCVDVVLLTFIMKGRGFHILEDTQYSEKGNSLAVTHYGQAHSIVTDSHGMEVMNIYLDFTCRSLPVLPEPLQNVLPEFLPIHPSFQHRLNRVVRMEFETDETSRLVKSMHDELQRRCPGFEEVLEMQFKLFLILCCRRLLEKGVLPSVPADTIVPQVEETRRFLDANYARKHTLDELAQRAELSKSYLCRSFKRYTGTSIVEYLLQRRIQSAMFALRSSSKKILSIALECGFQDLSFFNETFKKKVGKTPCEYRREHQKGVVNGKSHEQ